MREEHTGILPGSIIVFEHPAIVYGFAPTVDFCRINDRRFSDPALYNNLERFIQVFADSFENIFLTEKSVITVKYHYLMAQTIYICLQEYFTDIIDYWRLVSFFHDDEHTKKIIFADGKDAPEHKINILYDMIDFPFIKKIEIPFNAVLTPRFLKSLFENLV